MNNKTISLLAFTAGIAIVGYLVYLSFNQLKDIDFNLFDIEEDIDLEQWIEKCGGRDNVY